MMRRGRFPTTWRRRALSARPPRKPLRPAHLVALTGVLAPPRLHHTIMTGEVISKEAAAAYALDTFDARWRPLIRLALAYRLGETPPDDKSGLPRMVGE